ncbi:MAG TPA: hypothetical protein V6C95_07375, partial [Coleofasciculaceae cyanobacterium]
MSALTLQLPSVLKLTDEQFAQLAAANQDLQLELTARGELIIRPWFLKQTMWKKREKKSKSILIMGCSWG